MEQALYPIIDKEINMLSLKDYYKQLKAHDWFYWMADDTKTRKAGEVEEDRLLAIAEEHGEGYGDLWDAFDIYYAAKIKGLDPMPELPKEPA